MENALVVELKCVERFGNEHVAQCLNYLKASGLEVCLLVNFQRARVEVRRWFWVGMAMMESAMTVRISEAELAHDLHSVLARVQEGDEVIVEQDHRPVAVIKNPSPGPGRLLSECIALMKAREEALGCAPTLDDEFARDLEDVIASHREPLTPRWD